MPFELWQGLLIPFAGTTLGAACVFFMRNNLSELVQRALTGFAAGVMAVSYTHLDVYKRQGVHRRADVLPSGRISHCHQFAFAVHEPYRKTPPGICGTFWQR